MARPKKAKKAVKTASSRKIAKKMAKRKSQSARKAKSTRRVVAKRRGFHGIEGRSQAELAEIARTCATEQQNNPGTSFTACVVDRLRS